MSVPLPAATSAARLNALPPYVTSYSSSQMITGSDLVCGVTVVLLLLLLPALELLSGTDGFVFGVSAFFNSKTVFASFKFFNIRLTSASVISSCANNSFADAKTDA